MSETKYCETCGKELIEDTRQNKTARAARRFCDHKCAGQKQASNPNWKGAITLGLRKRWNNPRERDKAKQRFTGERNPNWSPVGTRFVSTTGRKRYWVVKCPDGRWRWEHRVIAEGLLGRKLLRSEHVHHIDGDGLNNVDLNLQVLDQRRHHQITFQEHAHACPICGMRHLGNVKIPN